MLYAKVCGFAIQCMHECSLPLGARGSGASVLRGWVTYSMGREVRHLHSMSGLDTVLRRARSTLSCHAEEFGLSP